MFELEINKVVDKKVLGEIVTGVTGSMELPAPVSYWIRSRTWASIIPPKEPLPSAFRT